MLGTTITADISDVLGKINWAAPGWDLFIILLFFVGTFVYSFSLGKDRIVVLTISLYASLAIASIVPQTGISFLKFPVNDQFFISKIIIFWLFFIFLFFLLSRSTLYNPARLSKSQGRLWQIILLSFLHVGLLISITLCFFPEEIISCLAPFSQKIFTTGIARLLWIIMPVLFTSLIKKKRRKTIAKDEIY